MGSCAFVDRPTTPVAGVRNGRIKGERASGWKIGVPRPRVDKSLSCIRYLSFPVALFTRILQQYPDRMHPECVQVTCYVMCQRVLCNLCTVSLFAINHRSSICCHHRVNFRLSRAIYAVTPLEPASKKRVISVALLRRVGTIESSTVVVVQR